MITSLVVVADSPVEVLEPTGQSSGPVLVGGKPRSGRVESLHGKVLAVIDSDSPGEKESYFSRALIRKFEESFELAEVIWVKKANRTHPPQPELWQEVVARADVGVAMFGGCGTCSSRTMRDAIDMEAQGIASVAIAHEDLRGAIEAMRVISKALDTPYILVTRPLVPSNDLWSIEATDALVECVFPAVVAELTVGSGEVRRTA